jgi:predicted secreted protein
MMHDSQNPQDPQVRRRAIRTAVILTIIVIALYVWPFVHR